MSIGDPRVWKHRSSLAKQGKETIAVREVLDQVSQETEPRPPRSRTGFGGGGSKPRVVRAQEREERPVRGGAPPGRQTMGLALPPHRGAAIRDLEGQSSRPLLSPGGPTGEEFVCRFLPPPASRWSGAPRGWGCPASRQLCKHKSLYQGAGPPQSQEVMDGALLT